MNGDDLGSGFVVVDGDEDCYECEWPVVDADVEWLIFRLCSLSSTLLHVC